MNDSIYNLHNDNYINTSNSSFIIKLSGKGSLNTSNSNNIYNNNGIGFKIVNNTSNNREIAIIDSSNINNNYSILNIGIVNNSISLNNNVNIPIIFNSNVYFSNSSIAINSKNTNESININGNINLTSNIFLNKSVINLNSNFNNTTYFNSSNLIVLSNIILGGTIYKTDGSPFLGGGSSGLAQWNEYPFNPNNIYYQEGYVGIGITNPTSILHLHSNSINSDVSLRISNLILSKDSNQSVKLFNYEKSSLIFGTNNIQSLIITSNGNIGINSSNSSEILTINGNLISSGLFLKSSNSIFFSSYLSNSSLNQNNIYYDIGSIGIGTSLISNKNSKLEINNNIICSNGFIGIGITNPNSYLHINSSNFNSSLKLQLYNLYLEKNSNHNILFYNYENSNLSLGTNGIERLSISSNGNIAIGNPLINNELLFINGNIILEGSLLNSNGSAISFNELSNSSINPNNIYYNNGLLGIGTNNPRGNSNVGLDIYNGNIVINNGFLGIGTNNPNSHLNIHSSQGILLNENNNKGIALFRDNNQNSLFWNYENNDLSLGTNGIERTIITKTGSIGIGTSQPLGILDVRGNIILEGSLLNSNGSAISFLQLSNSSINSNNIYYNNGILGIGTNNPRGNSNVGLDIYNGNIIINNGFLGIGTNNPNSHLNIHSSQGILLNENNNKGIALFRDNNQNSLFWNYENNDLSLGTNGIERTIITKTGSIGIGTSQPLGILDVRGNIILEGSLLNSNGSVISFLQLSNSSINSNNIYYNLGSIGIGTTNPRVNSGVDIYNSNIIINNGFLGIDTNNPTSICHVNSSLVSSSLVIQFTDFNNSQSSLKGFSLIKDNTQKTLLWNYENNDLSLGTNGIERTRITGIGSIGIGTSQPLGSLDIRGDIVIGGTLTKPDGTPISFLQLSNSSINANNIYYNLGSIGIGTNNPRNNGLDIYNNNCIVNNGLIGIGITNPNSVIHIHSSQVSSSLQLQLADINTKGFSLIKDSNQNSLLWNYENKDLSLGTNSSEKLKITSNGFIGIGIENPTQNLDINGNITLSGSLVDLSGNNVNLSSFSNSSIITNYINYTGVENTSNVVTGNPSFSYISFINNGTLTLGSSIVCDILVVGGGGGGGFDGAGGGGGGQVLYYTNDNVSFKSGNAITLNAGTYNINIGNGGIGSIRSGSITTAQAVSINGTNGATSSIVNASTSATIVSAKGGAGGGSRNNVGNGGDVGGAGGNGHANSGASQVSNNGGGSGGTNNGDNKGGGGGGGGANTSGTSKNGGNNQTSISRAGNGGAGVDINISGTSVGYGGGGGGGSWSYVGGLATHGGGSGNITNQNGNPQAGIANTGGGGGSGGNAGEGNPSGMNGGSGVVIIRFQNNISTNIYYNLGSLGIGTDNPNGSLDVNNNLILNNVYKFGIGNTNPNELIHLHSSFSNTNIQLQLVDVYNSFPSFKGFSLIKNENQSGLLWNNENQDLSIGISNLERIKIKNNGNIGIGSANPNQILDILGSNSANEYTIKGINVSNVIDSNILTTSNFLINYNNHLNIINSNLLLSSSNAQNTYFTITNSSNIFLTNSSANTNYTTKIEYNNKQNIISYNFPLSNSQLIYDSGFTLISSKLTKNNTLRPNSQWNNSNNNNIVIINSNIGIGIATIPTTRLHIENTITSTINSNSSIYIYNPNNSINNNSIISNKIGGFFANISSFSFDVNTAYGSSIYVKGNDSFKSLIFNKTTDTNQTAGNNIFRINSNNNIGVRIEDPKSLLHLSSTSVSTSIPINLNNIITIEKTINQEGRINNSSTNSSLLFGTNNNENIRISRDGYYGFNNNTSNNYILNIGTINSSFNFTGTGNTFNTVTNNNVYSYISFINSGTLILNSSMICDILIVGGGGSGGFTIGGGGGGGKVVYITNAIITAGTYNIIVGEGGAVNYDVRTGNKGGNSSFAGIIAEGGGGGSRYGADGSIGGSGGGAGADEIYSESGIGGSIGTETFLNGYIGNIYGNIGGYSSIASSDPSLSTFMGAGGGGGAGEIGQTGNINNNGAGGRGGNGIQINITGANLYWGAGGGGSQYYSSDNGIISRGGNGGLGGGGGGSSSEGYYGLGGTGGLNKGESANITYGGNGAANTGSGGGGGSYINSSGNAPYGGAGGSGIVIIRFLYVNNGINFTDINNISSNGAIAVFNNNLNFNTAGNSDITFLTNSTSEKIRIKNNSNIGIGNANPLSTLHVSGDVRLGYFDNNTYAIIKDDNNNIINPLIWYKFDNSTNIGLDEMNNYNLNNINSTTTSSDNVKGLYSANFNGVNQYLENISSPNLNNISFSISLWVKFNTLTLDSQGIFIIGNNNTDQYYPQIGIALGGNYVYCKFNLNGFYANKTRITSINDWYFIVFTYNTLTNVAKIYLNGILENELTYTSPLTLNSDTLWIGRFNAIYFENIYLNGKLDDFRIYNIELSQDHILNLYKVINFKKTNTLPYYDYNANTAINNSNFEYATNLTIKNLNITSNTFIPPFSATSSITYSGINNTSNFVSDNTNFNYINFINNGTLTLISPIVCDYLIVGGGGGGGGRYVGGGGGAGGAIYKTNQTILPGIYNIIVGQGGIGGSYSIKQTNGDNSSFNNDIAYGGGVGGSYYDNNADASPNGGNGGCGGGSSAPGYGNSASVGLGLQGYNGSSYGNNTGGGGGGMGGNSGAGGGGIGIQINITGVNSYYSGGGGGGSDYGAQSGGQGGGGAGGGNRQNGTNATANTGGGGGGAGGWAELTGGNGGSGIVIIRFHSSYYNVLIPPTINYIANNYAYYQITSSANLYLNNSLMSDILLVGAGGNGGSNLYSGGGGAGEVIYYPNYFLNTGSYTFNTGIGSTNIINRISKITYNSDDIIRALGGGDGGYLVYSSGTIPSYSTSGSGTVSALTNITASTDKYLMFTSGTSTLTLNNTTICDILVVGGGGGGGYDGAGGGGGGQVLYYTNDNVSFKSGNAITLNAGTYNINIGNGGLGSITSGSITAAQAVSTNGTNGATSSIVNASTSATIVSAKGGAGGGSRNNVGNGGDVGGAGGNGHANSGASQVSNNGGGSGGTNNGDNKGGGGGGGGANTSGTSKNGGNNQTSISRAGNGGAGVDINISGTSVGYGGGGGGGSWSYVGGLATHGGGSGNITNQNGNPQAGIANTGGGGGSGGHAGEGNPSGMNGGSGIVIIRFKGIYNNITPTSGGSGGGGAINQTGAIAGNPNASSFSYLRAGNAGTSTVGGNGGSATAGGRFTTTITGSSLQVGLGGAGVGASGSAVNGTNYGDGGSGNGGLGANGVIILRIPTTGDTTLNLTSTTTETNNLNCSNLINYNNTGILTSNPNYPLEIANTTITNNFTTSSGFLESSGISTKTSNQPNITVKANGSIWSTSSFIASSDSRIKTNIQDINDKQSLEKILKIEPKTYNYIDTISKGTSNVYGFIAEQIKEVIPEAITITEETIPNIYLEGNIKENNEIIIENDKYSNININDDIRIITSNSDEYYKIIEINNIKKSFKIDRYINENKCFIYGTKVNNFNILDKNYLYTLNIGATQELYKMITSNQNNLNIINEKINKLTYSK